MLLALDPSIGRCGMALFNNGLLTHAGVVTVKSSKKDIMRRVVLIGCAVRDWCPVLVEEIAAEWPQIYKATKSKGDPNDVVPLAGVCCAVAAYLHVGNVTSYLPTEWVGQVPKVETVKGCKSSPRARKIKARLSGTELDVWDLQVKYHDTIDAIGIGLHHLGRFDRKRVWGRS